MLCEPKCFMSSVGLVSLPVKCSGRLRSGVRVRVRVTESICSPEQTLSHVCRERDAQDVRAAWLAIAKISAHTIQQENGLPVIFSHDVIQSNKNEQIMTPPSPEKYRWI